MNKVNRLLKPFTNLVQSWLAYYNAKVMRLTHGSTFFIGEGKHYKIKCPLKNKDLKVAEIGVFEGINSEDLMKNLDIKELYLIDPWEEYENNPMGSLENAEAITKRRMKKYGDKIKYIKEYSSNAINKIPNNLDFIYIDGNHDYKFVKEDLNNYWNKVKIGGVFAGHDMLIPDVLKAVLEFVEEKKVDFFIVGDDWVIIKEQPKGCKKGGKDD